MNAFQLILTFSLLTTVLCSFPKEGDVIVLSDANFDEIINAQEIILVEFYAPWCGHCKHLEPEYAKAATSLLANDPPVLLAKMDATANEQTANRFSVRGYPTLKIFRKGVASEYGGPREADGIVNYMKKQVGPSSKLLNSVEEIEAFLKNDDVSVVGFFTETNYQRSDLYRAYQSAANAQRDEFRFAETKDAAALQKWGFTNQIVLFKPFDEKPSTYIGHSDDKAIETFVFANCLPHVGIFSQSKSARYQRNGLPILKLYVDIDPVISPKQATYFFNRLKKVAADYQGKLYFTIAKRGDFQSSLTEFAIGQDDVGLTIEESKKSQKFKFTGDKFSVEGLKQFVDDWAAKKLKPFIKSEKAPVNNDGPVTVVVGETFNQIVMDETKDVLIEFYAPWCGHCKKLDPIYNELGTKFKNIDSVVIAKVDATANDYAPEFAVSGFPTIYFAPANNKKKPILFSGERDLKTLNKFVRDNVSIKIAPPAKKQATPKPAKEEL